MNSQNRSTKNFFSTIRSLKACKGNMDDHYDFPNLQTLDLSEQNLSTVPESIKKYDKLSVLILDCNKITELPDWIIELDSLETLSLCGNQLTTLPKSLKRMKNLRQLYLVNNYNLQVPDSLIPFMKQLQGFSISIDHLTAVTSWETYEHLKRK